VAFEYDPELQQDAFKKRILICTPVTLFALLRTVGIYWQQVNLAENAREIADQSRQLYEHLVRFTDSFSKIGKGLKSAVSAYNSAVGTYDGRIVPSGRRIEKLDVTEQVAKKLTPPEELDQSPRKIKHTKESEENDTNA